MVSFLFIRGNLQHGTNSLNVYFQSEKGSRNK